MTAGWWSDDDELLSALREARGEERDVPAHFVEAGKAVFTWHSIDAELAAITYDSLAEALPTAVTRAEHAAIRELTFAARHVTIHIQVAGDSLHGQVVPPQRGEIEVHVRGRTPQVIEVDEQGWFAVAPVPRASFRLLYRTLTGSSALTDWLTI